MTLLTIVLATTFASSVDPFSGGDRKLTLGLSAADNRRAIQRAVDKASAEGGGRVEIPIGTWTTGSIQLKDGVELRLPQGATLKGSVDRCDYNANDAFPENRWSEDEEWSGGHLVWARCARDISITGPGVIDGNGPAFFGACDEETRFPHYKYGLKLHPTDREWFRPGIMVAFFRCQNVRVEDVKLVRTTAWTCHFRCCDGVTLRNVTVDADRTIANSDGLSIDCTRNVVIEGCTLLTGDDGVPIRASCPFHAATNFCENIVIRNCDIWSCNYGIRFGVGTGLIRNVRVSDVRVHEAANAGIGFTPAWKAGPRNCYIEDVEIDNCTLLECAHPVIAGSANDSMVRNVRICNCRFETLLPNLIWGGSRCSMSFENCMRMPIERVKVRHQSGWHEEEIRKGWSTFAEVRDDASAVRMTNCRVGEARNTAWMRGSVGISVHWTATLPCADGSEISFEEAVRGFDVERFVSVLAAVGAQHLIFTEAHARQILPMPNAALDAIAPGRTSSRDLFGEILDACGKRGIRVIAYYNHSCNGAHPEVVKWMRQCGCPHTPDGCGDEVRFETNICAIVREISQRYGRKISGWWFDSAYSVDSRGPYVGFGDKWQVRGKDEIDVEPVEFPWQRLLDAARSGNPDAAVAINSGVGQRFQYCDDTDYYAGESVSFSEHFEPEADGRRIDSRWITLDDPQWTFGRNRGFLPFRTSMPELQAYVREHVRAGRLVTFNILIDRRGQINPAITALGAVLTAR